jgi:hypothetical protein
LNLRYNASVVVGYKERFAKQNKIFFFCFQNALGYPDWLQSTPPADGRKFAQSGHPACQLSIQSLVTGLYLKSINNIKPTSKRQDTLSVS